jgi:ABC-2 type transport system permease protein
MASATLVRSAPLVALVVRSAVQARYVVGGAVLVFFVFQFLVIAQAVEIERANAFGRLQEFIPEFLQRGLGAQALLLATFRGTVAAGYFHPAVVCMLSLVAIYLATEPAYDSESGRVDLLLARPLPRRRLLTRSLLTMLLSVAGIVLCMLAGTATGVALIAPDDAAMEFGLVLLLAVHLVMVAWCCGAIGLFFGSISRRWTTAFTSGAAIVVIGYLIDFLAIGWPPARPVSWLFPFNYFPALYILGGTSNPPRDLAILGTAIVVFTVLAYRRFTVRDL